jgi:hypothetical protein
MDVASLEFVLINAEQEFISACKERRHAMP